MSDKMMKICGKNPDGNATAIGIDANGNLKIKRVWETAVETISYGNGVDYDNSLTKFVVVDENGNVVVDENGNSTLQSTTTRTVDVSDWGMISLRIANTLKAGSNPVPVTISFRRDVNDNMGSATTYSALRDPHNNIIQFTVNHNSVVTVMSEDFPILNYLTQVRLIITPSGIPTQGSLHIAVVKKR